MAEEPAFDPAKCTTKPISRISPCDVLLTDDNVNDAPPNIPDCPDDPLSLPPEAPCPTITPLSDTPKGDITYGGTYTSNPPSVKYYFSRGSCCDFDLFIDTHIPCPTIGPSSDSKAIGWTDGVGSIAYGFSKNLDTCEFSLDISADIHCPQMSPSESSPVSKPFLSGGGTVSYYFAKSDGCDWTLDVDVSLDAATCPLLTPITPTSAFIDFATGTQGTISYEFIRGEACDYELSITATSPCVSIEPQTPTTLYFYTSGGIQAYISYYFSKGTDCDYTLHISGDLPASTCTEVSPQTLTTVSGTYGTSASISYVFNKISDCDYTLELSDFTVPCVVIGPTTTTHTYVAFASGSQGDISYHFTKTSDCDYTLSLTATSPCSDIEPQTPTTLYFYTSNGSQAYLSYYFSKGTNCDYTLHMSGNFPPAAGCPNIQPQTNTTAYSSYGSQGSISYYFDKDVDCNYTLHLDYVAPCPVIGPEVIQYVPLYTAGGLPGYISYYFTKIGCEYELTIDATLPCVNIEPQIPTYTYFYSAPGGQAYLRYYFTKGDDCDYVLSISGSFPPPASESIWIRITGRSRTGTETRYSFVEVTNDAADNQIDVPGGIVGNITDIYAQDIDLVATDALFEGDMFVSESASDSEPWFIAENQRFQATRNKLVSNCWLFKSSSCTRIKPTTPSYAYFYSAPGGQAYLRYYFIKNSNCEYVLDISGAFPLPEAQPTTIYVTITGRDGSKYSFVQAEPNSSGVATQVDDGITGSTSSNFLRDINGFADDGIINKSTWAVKGTTLEAPWIMGPWVKEVEYPFIDVEPVCDDEGNLTVTLVQSPTPVIRYRIGYG